MTIGLIVLIAFLALVVMGGVILALLDRAPLGFEDSQGLAQRHARPGIGLERL